MNLAGTHLLESRNLPDAGQLKINRGGNVNTGIIKKVFFILIILAMVFGIVPEFLPDMATNSAVVSDNTSMPTVLRLVFRFWWVAPGFLMLGIIMNNWQSRRRSRRRRR